jgi:hypothetical protein
VIVVLHGTVHRVFLTLRPELGPCSNTLFAPRTILYSVSAARLGTLMKGSRENKVRGMLGGRIAYSMGLYSHNHPE